VVYSPPYVDVYQNGVRLNVVDYTATSGTSITLAVGAAVNDEIEVIGFSSDASITASYSGSTAPAVPIEGMMWYDTTDGSLYVRTTGVWVEASQAGATQGIQGIQGPPGDGVVISGITVTDASYNNTDDTAVSLTGGYIKVTGTGFVSGCTIVVGNVIATSVTFISSTEVRAQLPALAAGTYILYVSNPSGAVAIRVNAITFSALPTWVSTSPLANGKLNTAISIQLSGTSDSAVVYALQSGSTLPAGLTLSSGGLLSGTVTGISVETTYNFTVVATDAELQDSPKAFSITITVLYVVAKSLRFRAAGGSYLNRTLTTATNPLKWTWSAWVKRGRLGAGGGLFQGYSSISVRTAIQFNSSDQLLFNGSVATATTTAVFRDPAAWYHIVCVYDSANATAGNRLILYVNGAIQTVTGTQPTSSQVEYINSASRHYFSAAYSGAWEYHDGEMTEVNFIDGQALTPASFGEVSVTSGAWIPKAYASTYGINGFYLPFTNVSSTTTYAGLFNGSSQYVATASLPAFGTSSFTQEAWVYITGAAITNGANARLWSLQGINLIYEASVSQLRLDLGVSAAQYITSASELTLSTWHHVAVVRSGTTVNVYVDGISKVTITRSDSLAGGVGYIGSYDATSGFFQGYISNFRSVNGTAVYTSNFSPTIAPLTAVTNTTVLTLQGASLVDNSGNSYAITNGGSVVMSVQNPFVVSIGKDSSGNNNNWTPNYVSLTAGSNYDSMLDSPVPSSATVGNYATWNPLYNVNNSGAYLSQANLTFQDASTTGAWHTTIATIAPAYGSAKFYWEGVLGGLSASAGAEFGILLLSLTSAGINPPSNAQAWGIYWPVVGVYSIFGNSATTATSITPAVNDTLMVAFDAVVGQIWLGVNGTWIAGNPSAGTGPSFTGITSNTIPFASTYSNTPGNGGGNTGASVNFGQRPFTYTPPTGFLALNTYNLPASAVLNPATAMAATTYTGNGSTQNINNAINGISFQPDLVWTKSRNNAYNNTLYDSVRGIGNTLFSDATNAEQYSAQRLTSFNSNGYGYGSDSGGNYNATTYVAWQWKAGGAVSANNNTAGTITSTVSANQAAGFSVVGYTGTGANATIGHGLGVAPSFMIIKSRNNADNWYAYHTSLGNTLGLNPNLTSSAYSSALYWNSTTPTASVFSIGTVPSQTAWTYIAYCWAPVAGYSAFGKYTGNGSNDGPFVYTGFKPRYILLKNTSVGTAGYDWEVIDASRSINNVANAELAANLSNVESSSWNAVDILSNGFKLRDLGAAQNGSGNTMIYAAFAETAFNFATAR
jgi:hypothetical protein